MATILDIKAARTFIEQAIKHYQRAPGWFTDWLDDLYIRLGENYGPITLDELFTLTRLYSDESWMPEQFAVNIVYHLFDRLGRDTSGIIGY